VASGSTFGSAPRAGQQGRPRREAAGRWTSTPSSPCRAALGSVRTRAAGLARFPVDPGSCVVLGVLERSGRRSRLLVGRRTVATGCDVVVGTCPSSTLYFCLGVRLDGLGGRSLVSAGALASTMAPDATRAGESALSPLMTFAFTARRSRAFGSSERTLMLVVVDGLRASRMVEVYQGCGGCRVACAVGHRGGRVPARGPDLPWSARAPTPSS
jgi:hypothetical protein